MNSYGRLLSSLHGSGCTIFVPGFDYDSGEWDECLCQAFRSCEPLPLRDLEQHLTGGKRNPPSGRR